MYHTMNYNEQINDFNRSFPSSPGPLYQNEVRCSAFDMEMISASAGFLPRRSKPGPRRHPRSPCVYREENFAVAGKISIFENTARKGLPKVRWE